MKSEGFIGKYVKIIVIFAVIAGSSSGIFGKAIEAPSMAIGFWRLTLGLPFFALPVLIGKRQELKELSLREMSGALLAGVFLFAHFFSWFNAVKMTNIASAVVLAALHPLVVLAITVFIFKKHVGARPIMGIVLALLGGTLVAGFDRSQLSAGSFNGDVLAFLAAVQTQPTDLTSYTTKSNKFSKTRLFLQSRNGWPTRRFSGTIPWIHPKSQSKGKTSMYEKGRRSELYVGVLLLSPH